MRIVLILLSIIALIFIGSVTWSLIGQGGWEPKTRTALQNVDNITLETWKNQIKTDEKIEKLSAMVEELSKTNLGSTPKNTDTPTENTEIQPVKISGQLLSLLMPSVTPTLIENRGIFGLYVFDKSIGYSTYTDEKYGLTLIPMNIPYSIFLKNARALAGNPYTVNETKSFPFPSFYLNPAKSDTLVRLIVEIESQTIAIEIPKTKFPLLKDLLIPKGNSNTQKKK